MFGKKIKIMNPYVYFNKLYSSLLFFFISVLRATADCAFGQP